MFAWDEQQGVTLASPVKADITTPGNYSGPGVVLSTGTIPAGTIVDSHFFHSLRLSGTSVLTGTLTFPTDVLGVEVIHKELADTNVLGSPGTDYTEPSTNDGLEFGTGDAVFMPDLRTVTLQANTSTNSDNIRIITKHNAPPTDNAGGPYAGVEGSPTTLHGVAADPENDPLTISWSFSTTGSPGTVCTPTATTTLSPSITCNDNAVVTATLSVKDALHAAVLSSAQVTIANVAPALGALTVPGAPVAQGAAVNVSASFTDAGTNDTHTATVDWGDTTSGAATITESAGSGSLAKAHTYGVPGHFTVTVTLRDDDGGTSVRTASVVVNGAPTADAGGPYVTTEGSSAGLTGTASDPEGDPLAKQWTFSPTGTDPGTTCTSTGTTTLTPTVTCNDDAVVNSQLSVSDNVNPPTLSTTTITVNNVAPVLAPLTTSGGPIAVGATADVSAAFTDAGTNDTHTASVNWGDLATTNATITETSGSGSLTTGHAYTHAGLYTVTVTLAAGAPTTTAAPACARRRFS